MKREGLTLSGIISEYGEFLCKFGMSKDEIEFGHQIWRENEINNSTFNYFLHLIGNASLWIARHSNSELEYFEYKLEIDETLFEFRENLTKEYMNYLIGEINYDKLLISYHTLPFRFNVQIFANDHCSICKKWDKKIVTVDKIVEKKTFSFEKCKNSNGCGCSYSIIPLLDGEI